MDWTEPEMLQTLKVYVDIRDRDADQSAAIGRLAALLGRTRSSVEAAVMAPAKDDPMWKGKRPHRGLTNKLAASLWAKYSKDLPGLFAVAARDEEWLRTAKR